MNRYIGAHISKDKTIFKTMENIIKKGGNTLQIFVSNPRSIKEANIKNYEEIAEEIKNFCSENDFKLVIHSSYTVNISKELKNNNRIIDIEDAYWVKLLKSELIISHLIGSIGVIVHVGKYTTLDINDALINMKNCISHIIEFMKTNNLNTKLLLETPAGQGTELLTEKYDFIEFYKSFTENEKKYFGICVDTAHLWGNGNNMIDFIKKSKDFIDVVHLNNSSVQYNSKLDRHACLLDKKAYIDIKLLNEVLKLLKKETIIILEEPSDDNLEKEFKWIKSSFN